MITIQRVRVRWTAAGRGAPEADRRRGLNASLPLPAGLPRDEVVLHDVLAAEPCGYVPHVEVRGGGLELGRDAGFELEQRDGMVVVFRLPGWGSHPRTYGKKRLFALGAGEVGRYRTNFRWAGCQCDPHWNYDEWHVHIANGSPAAGRFVADPPDHEADHRIHLYGGRRRILPGRGQGR